MNKLLAIAVGAALLTAGAARADKAEDAARYTKDLKTAKDTKTKVTAALEIGKLSMIRKSFGKEALPYLLDGVKDKDARFRGAAAESLGQTYSGEEDAKIVTLLSDLVKNDKEESVKMSAGRGLAAMGPRAKPAIPVMREIMNKEPQQSPLRRSLQQSMRTINGR